MLGRLREGGVVLNRGCAAGLQEVLAELERRDLAQGRAHSDRRIRVLLERAPGFGFLLIRYPRNRWDWTSNWANDLFSWAVAKEGFSSKAEPGRQSRTSRCAGRCPSYAGIPVGGYIWRY